MILFEKLKHFTEKYITKYINGIFDARTNINNLERSHGTVVVEFKNRKENHLIAELSASSQF